MTLLLHTALCPFLLLLLAPLTSSQTTECQPGENCLAPDCRCWNDSSIPGGLQEADIPQVIVVTFQNAVNTANVDLYTALFQDVLNPNNCPAVGTFYVQQTNSDMTVIKELADSGHEIGVTTIDGTLPTTMDAWITNIAQVRDAVVAAGVPEARVLGVRAPQLQPGGLQEFTALAQENFLYDFSCTTMENDTSFLWPFTYDFAPGPKCDSGNGPEEVFPGKWEMMIADLEFNGVDCATPAACPGVVTQRDAFDLFYNSFIKHYEGSRSPFVIVINPEWAVDNSKREGTRQFLQYVRAAFGDTWLLTATQTLEWVRNPVPSSGTSDFPPWACLDARGAPHVAKGTPPVAKGSPHVDNY